MGKKRVRNRKLEFWVKEDEVNLIDKKVKSSGLDRSKYLRKVALGQPIINIDLSRLDSVIYELNKIGTNINQIAKYCNSNNVLYKSDVDEIQDKMNRIWELISKSF